jgi:hypothetical protein
MLSREERKSANKASAERNLKLRETRSNAREERKAIKEKLRGVNNTSDKRAIKSGAIYDLSTNSYAAKKKFPSTGERNLQDTAPDFVSRDRVEEGGGGGGGLYAFKVVDDGDGTVSVTVGTVNTSTATALTPFGKPTALWLDVTFDATSGDVTAAAVAITSGTTSSTKDYRQIATITWDGDTPTIVQGIKGSQSIASCGATHQWGTLYS